MTGCKVGAKNTLDKNYLYLAERRGVEVRPETEVVAKAQRRRFTAEYKRRIVREADRSTAPGAIGALLRSR